MKKFIFVAVGLVVCLLGALNVVLNAQTDRLSDLTLAGTEAIASEESSDDCKWQKVKCPGFLVFKQFEVCTFDGSGHSCICGATTRDECN